jgi:hypothetical protein
VECLKAFTAAGCIELLWNVAGVQQVLPPYCLIEHSNKKMQ